jgi:hypothetical protein
MCGYGEESAPIVYFVHSDLRGMCGYGEEAASIVYIVRRYLRGMCCYREEAAPIVLFVHSDLEACVAMGRKLHPFCTLCTVISGHVWQRGGCCTHCVLCAQ